MGILLFSFFVYSHLVIMKVTTTKKGEGTCKGGYFLFTPQINIQNTSGPTRNVKKSQFERSILPAQVETS